MEKPGRKDNTEECLNAQNPERNSAQPAEPQNAWNEELSREFIDYGRYFVPERERQLQTIVDLLPHSSKPGVIIDLCCGEGLLAEAILEQRSEATVYGLDISAEMRQRATERNARFGDRFRLQPFDIFDRAWPEALVPVCAVVSSLAVHHLEGLQKRDLFREIFNILTPGGVFILADVMEPASPAGWEVAAKAWDEAVRQRALQMDESLDAFLYFDRHHWNMYRHFDPEDIDRPSPVFTQLKWLDQTGFIAVDVFWMQAGHAMLGGMKASEA